MCICIHMYIHKFTWQFASNVRIHVVIFGVRRCSSVDVKSMHAYTYVYIYTSYARILCMYMRAYIYIQVMCIFCIYIYTSCVHVQNCRIYIQVMCTFCVNVYLHRYIYTCIYIQVMYICSYHIYESVYLYVHLYTYINIYLYTHVYTIFGRALQQRRYKKSMHVYIHVYI